MDINQCFKTLNILTSASINEVKHAYRELANEWHPDRFVNDPISLQKEAEERMKDINVAYEKILIHISHLKEKKKQAESNTGKRNKEHTFTDEEQDIFDDLAKKRFGSQMGECPYCGIDMEVIFQCLNKCKNCQNSFVAPGDKDSFSSSIFRKYAHLFASGIVALVYFMLNLFVPYMGLEDSSFIKTFLSLSHIHMILFLLFSLSFIWFPGYTGPILDLFNFRYGGTFPTFLVRAIGWIILLFPFWWSACTSP